VSHERRAASFFCTGLRRRGQPAAFGRRAWVARGLLARDHDRGYLQGFPACSLRLAAQDVALSRRKQGFESPRERQRFQQLVRNNAVRASIFGKVLGIKRCADRTRLENVWWVAWHHLDCGPATGDGNPDLLTFRLLNESCLVTLAGPS
jgi:hypothetical protein